LPVIAHMHEPVALGSSSLWPGRAANFTGLSSVAPELAEKRLELFKSILPNLKRLAVLWKPGERRHGPGMAQHAETPRVSSGSSCARSKCANAEELLRAFERVKTERPQAFAALLDSRMRSYRKIVVDFAGTERLPTLFGSLEFVASWADVIRREPARHVPPRCGVRGQDPQGREAGRSSGRTADQVELAINLKTAKALGLAIPQSLLLRVDRIIE